MRTHRFLLVAPSLLSSGEAITLLHMAEAIERNGDECVLLAGGALRRVAQSRIRGAVLALTDSLEANRALWKHALAISAPHAIVFADYPLMFHSSGVAPLADEAWALALERLDAALVTFDHLGLASAEGRIIPFGPPHMTFALEVTARLPPGMRVLLPCPIHDPASAQRPEGIAFRSWSGTAGTIDEARTTRQELGVAEHELLVLYSTPAWASRIADDLRLPHHRYVLPILRDALHALDRPVAVAMMNAVTDDEAGEGVRGIALPPLPVDRFERLVGAADLVLTDNVVSSAMGKAIQLRRPCAALVNSHCLSELHDIGDDTGVRWASAMERERIGSVFPWDVFPVWSKDDLHRLGMDRNPGFRRAYARVEMFGGDNSGEVLADLLDGDGNDVLASARHAYNGALDALPGPYESLRMALA